MKSILAELETQIDEVKAKNDALNYDDLFKKQKEKNADSKNKEIEESNARWDSQITSTQNYYDREIGDTKQDYDDLFAKNAVQKEINQQLIAEKNAALGLSNSGLNSTQQTSAQLAHSNAREKISSERQSDLDSLNLALTDAITTLKDQKESDAKSIEKSWDTYSATQASELYNAKYTELSNERNGLLEQYVNAYIAELAAEVELEKERINASAKIPTVSYGAGGTISGGYIVSSETGTLSRDYKGSLKDNDVDTVYSYSNDGSIKSVTYTDKNSGISATFDGGVNPYTGKMNKDVCDADGNYDPSKAFDNGYQPNNINGNNLKVTDATWTVFDREQKIFKLESNDKYGYYVWRGDLGKYQKLTAEEAASVGLY